MSSLSLQRLTLLLVMSLWMCGAVTTLLGFLGGLYPILSLCLIVPATAIILSIVYVYSLVRRSQLNTSERFLLATISTVWLLHFIGAFLPETGFDAVWYHLSVVDYFVDHHRILYWPEYYQSVNPLFSDVIFLLGYQLGGEVGAKLVAYLFGLTLVAAVYQLARQFISRNWALWVVLIVSLFQVVSWQASSFYVDVAKAVWELATLWLLVLWSHKKNSKWLVLSGLAFGASLGTKLFSIFLVPIVLVCVVLVSQRRLREKCRSLLIFTCSSVGVALPFYIFTWLSVGHPFYSLVLNTAILGEVGASPVLYEHIRQRLVQAPWVLWQLLIARDYVSPLVVLFLPFVWWQRRRWWTDRRFLSLVIFSTGQLTIWWFLPPLSTRYALSGFIVWLLVCMWSVEKTVKQSPYLTRPLTATLLLCAVLTLMPRLVVLNRALPYLLGNQTQETYYARFYDGVIDDHLDAWRKRRE